jgi:hypothetical protein
MPLITNGYLPALAQLKYDRTCHAMIGRGHMESDHVNTNTAEPLT